MSIFDTSQSIPVQKRNLFDLSRENIFTTEFGYITPIMCEPLFPGDSFRLRPSVLVKSAPMLAPIYGTINVDIHAFVVPLRLLWKEFDKWIYDQTNVNHVPPHVSKKTLIEASRPTNLLNYLGIPQGKDITSNKELNIFKILGYLQIWKEYFRDEDLQTYPDFLDDNSIEDYNTLYSQNTSEFTSFKKRCWRKDYFTSARPWPQKGTPPVLSLFQSQEIPVSFRTFIPQDAIGKRIYPTFLASNSSAAFTYNNMSSQYGEVPQSYPSTPLIEGESGTINWFWDTSLAAGVDVAQLRTLFAVQKFLEKSAIVGSRYIEGNLAFFGTKIKDYRAQLPEFIGMTSQTLTIDEVVQNSETDKSLQGHRTGQASTAFSGRTFKYFASEFSLVYVLMSIRPRAVYFQGLGKFWKQLDQFDFPFPDFQSIGEQPISFDELIVGDHVSDDDMDETFGYQSRYAEIRSAFDEVHGNFVSNLNFWHLARMFDREHTSLNSRFITIEHYDQDFPENSLDRIFAVLETSPKDQDHHFWCDAFIEWKVKRKFHYHTTPALIG